MSPMVKAAGEHWHYVAPLLNKPRNEAEYDALVTALDELLEEVGEDENHPLTSLVEQVGDLIQGYDEKHRPIPAVGGIEVLRYLMQEHQLSQSNLPEIGAQSVVSEVLSGKRQLNVRQIRGLSERFKVSPETFI